MGELNAESFKTMVRKDGDISRVLRVIGAIIFGNTMEGKRKGVDAEEARREGAQRDEAETYAAMKAVHRFGKVARPGSCDVADEAPVHTLQVQSTKESAVASRGKQGCLGCMHDTPMFALQDRLTQGSLAAARGTRVCLGCNVTRSSQRSTMQADQRLGGIKKSTASDDADETQVNTGESLKATSSRLSQAKQQALGTHSLYSLHQAVEKKKALWHFTKVCPLDTTISNDVD